MSAETCPGCERPMKVCTGYAYRNIIGLFDSKTKMCFTIRLPCLDAAMENMGLATFEWKIVKKQKVLNKMFLGIPATAILRFNTNKGMTTVRCHD